AAVDAAPAAGAAGRQEPGPAGVRGRDAARAPLPSCHPRGPDRPRMIPTVATTLPAPDSAVDGPPRARRTSLWAVAGVALTAAIGVVLRLHSPSALWLDEAIGVSISGLPLHEVPAALRHDG